MAINPVLQTGLLNQSSAQVIDGSLRFDKDKTTHLKRTFPYTGDVKRWTWSCWFQRTHFDSGTSFYRIFGSTETNHFYFYEDDLYFDLEGTSQRLITNQKFRDNGWYHLVVILDTPNTTSSDRMRLYINGERITSFSTANYPALHPYQGGFLNGRINRDLSHDIGYRVSPAGGALSANISQVYFISGQTLEPEYFGFTDPLTGTWRPKKFGYFNSAISTQYSGASALTWDDNPIGSVYTLSNGNRTATASGGGSGYSGADVWSNAIPANSTTAWTLDVTNSDNVGGWYFTDSQTESGTHPDERGGNSLGMRNQDNDAGWFGTFATANGGSNSSHILDLPEADTWGSKRVDFVVYRPASGTGKVWVKDNNVSTWIGGGDPSNTSSTPSFIIPDGDTYFGYTFYDRTLDQIATLDGDGSIQQKIGPTSFYLPFDGNSPIGQDKSGNGNDFTPVNFGGSAGVDQATGALPILEGAGGAVANVGVRTDAYAANLVLALPLVGSANDVSNRINSGSTTKAVTVSGAVASSVQSNLYGGSFFFDGSDDFLNVPDGTDFTVGSGPFTLEFWAYKTASGEDFFCGSSNSGGQTASMSYSVQTGGGSPSNSLRAHVGDGSSLYTVNSGMDFVLNKWVHIAFVRDGNTLRLFQDGVQVDTTSFSGTVKDSADPFMIGRGFGANSHKNFPGYIQDFRFYKGVAKYTSNFIPAATSPDIIPDTPSGVAGGSKLNKIIDGAVAFNGSNGYLTLPSRADFAFGTGDFTVECYVYSNNRGTYDYIIDGRTSGQTSGTWSLGYGYAGGNGRLEFASGSSTLLECPASLNPETNKWTHIAITRSGTDLRMFIDGVVATSATNSTNFSTEPGTSYIGTRYSQEHFWDGFISNIRVIKGTALYTANFTPPTEPLTNVTNTKLLCCQSNTSATAAAVEPSTIGYTGPGAITLSSASLDAGAVANIVDGNTSTSADIRGAGSFVQMVFPQQQNGTLQVNVANGNDVGDDNIRVFIDGVEGTSFDVSSQQWYTIHTGNFTTVKLEHQGSTTGYIYGFRIGTSGDTIINGGITANGDAAATNFNPFNTNINTVRGQETGYCTMNPLTNLQGVTLSDGNLKCTWPSDGDGEAVAGTLGIPMGVRGKFYWELDVTAGTGGGLDFGIVRSDQTKWTDGTISNRLYNLPEFAGLLGNSGAFRNKTGTDSDVSNYLSSTANGSSQTFMVCVDALEGKMWIGKNGVWGNNGGTGNPALGTNPGTSNLYKEIVYSYLPVMMGASDSGTSTTVWNFGQKPFKFPPPDGFQPLNNTSLIPETVITRPDQYVGTTTWSGDDADPRQINLGMAPDLIWVKTTNQTNWHWLSDSLRGTADKRYKLYSNDDTAQDTTPIYGQADSFNDFGFVAGGGTNNAGEHLSDSNKSGTNYICYSWKAGGSKGTFNVDDVGYASASDVNMNVDALSNKTQDWSGNATGGQNVGRAFDGTGPRKDHYSHTSGSLTVNFSPAISGRIIVYGGAGGSGARTFTLSDGSSLSSGVVYDTAPYYSTLDFGVKSNITSLTCSNGYTLYAISLDGKLLVDSGLSVNVPSIAPSGCSVGTKQGFSIIRYQANSTAGATIPHGLSQAPTFVLVKSLETAGSANSDWTVFHSTLGGTKAMYLNEQNGSNSTGSWNDTNPNANVITLGTAHVSNLSPNHYIAYAWHDVPGLQKFGSYGGADAFVELGFRPAILIIKSESSSRNWIIIDSERDKFNPSDRALLVNDNAIEDDNSVYAIDFLSNGFKIRGSNGQIDGDSSYIYAAWAEAPAVNLYGGQSNAR